MAEYIDRQELLKDIEDSVRFSTRNGVSAELRGAHKIVDRIRSAPACDVVEVVRCKNCKHGKIDDSGTTICVLNSECDAETGIDYGFVSYCAENHFCSYGERKSDNV